MHAGAAAAAAGADKREVMLEKTKRELDHYRSLVGDLQRKVESAPDLHVVSDLHNSLSFKQKEIDRLLKENKVRRLILQLLLLQLLLLLLLLPSYYFTCILWWKRKIKREKRQSPSLMPSSDTLPTLSVFPGLIARGWPLHSLVPVLSSSLLLFVCLPDFVCLPALPCQALEKMSRMKEKALLKMDAAAADPRSRDKAVEDEIRRLKCAVLEAEASSAENRLKADAARDQVRKLAAVSGPRGGGGSHTGTVIIIIIINARGAVRQRGCAGWRHV